MKLIILSIVVVVAMLRIPESSGAPYEVIDSFSSAASAASAASSISDTAVQNYVAPIVGVVEGGFKSFQHSESARSEQRSSASSSEYVNLDV